MYTDFAEDLLIELNNLKGYKCFSSKKTSNGIVINCWHHLGSGIISVIFIGENYITFENYFNKCFTNNMEIIERYTARYNFKNYYYDDPSKPYYETVVADPSYTFDDFKVIFKDRNHFDIYFENCPRIVAVNFYKDDNEKSFKSFSSFNSDEYWYVIEKIKSCLSIIDKNIKAEIKFKGEIIRLEEDKSRTKFLD